MATIDFLMQGKKPGEIKITCPNLGEGHYFIPYFKSLATHAYAWYGLDERHHSYATTSLEANWQIYTGPFPFKLTYEIEENGRHYTGTIASTSILNCAKELVLLVQERCGNCGKFGRMCSHL